MNWSSAGTNAILMDDYLFSYAAPTDPAVKRHLIWLVERATGQPVLKRLYVDNQRSPRPSESFWAAAVRSLALDVLYDEAALARLPRSGPTVVRRQPPLWRARRAGDFVAGAEGAVRFPGAHQRSFDARARGARLHSANRFFRDAGSARDEFEVAGGGEGPARPGRRGGGVSGGRRLDGARSARPSSGGRRALAAVRLPAHSAIEGDRRSHLVRRSEQPSVPDRQPRQPDTATVADLSRSQERGSARSWRWRSARRFRSRRSPPSGIARRWPIC